MSEEEQALNRLLRALHKLDQLNAYGYTAQDDSSLQVEWRGGSATAGYKAMAEAIAVETRERWNEMAADARLKATHEVGAARLALRAILGNHAVTS